mgnify:CR=1 FL=1
MISRDHHARSSRTAPNPRNHLGRPSDVALKNQHVMRTIWMVHNHPSGDPTPSDADIAMTARIAQAADSMGITIHDHLIIGKSRELSFRSEGLL